MSALAPARPETMADTAAGLAGGWAGDLVRSDGALWLAWSAAPDTEEALFAPAHWERPVKREESLREGATPDQWRRTLPEPMTVWLGRIDGERVTDRRALATSPHAVEGPTAAPLPGGPPVVVWAEWSRDGSTLVASVNGEREIVARSRGAILGPRAAGDGRGSVWVAWQEWPALEGAEARPAIRASRRGARGEPGVPWSEPVTISAGDASAWAPSLAIEPDGVVWCAWDAWDPLETGDGGAYRVRLRAASPTGEWGDTADVSPPDHNHYHFAPDVAAAAGRAWIVWNASSRWGLLNHRFNHMRTLHAALAHRDDTGAVTVEPAPGETPLGFAPGQLPVASLPFLHMLEEEFVTPQAPRVRLAPATPGSVADSPVVFFRRFRSTTLKDFGWTLEVMRHTGAGWSPPEPVSSSAGFPDAPYGVLADGASWMLAYHSGEYPEAPDRNPSCAVRGHRLAVERVTLAPSPIQRPARVAHRRPSDKEWVLSPARAAQAAPARAVETDGGPLHLLYGDLHRHSVYSKCMSANDGDPLDHWRWVQDVAALDFYALTEHLEYMSALEWRRVQDLAQRIASGGRVLALCGFELVLPPGHTNFFYADDAVGHDLRVACLTSATLEEVWPKLDAWIPEGKVVAIRHSQGHRGDEVPRSYAPRWEPVAEIVQTRGDYAAWVRGLWQHGMKLGVVGASDHARGAPFVQCITGLWVPPGDRTREGVLSGLRARRTFATNGPRMSVWLTARGEAGGETLLMGDEGSVSGAPRLTIEVSGTRALESVELFRDEAQIARWTPGDAHATLEHTDAAASPGEHAYWVRVTQGQEKVGRRPVRGLAYSSPAWVTL